MTRVQLTLIAGLLTWICSACHINSKYERFYSINREGWSKDSTLNFPVHFDKDKQSYDLSMHIRNTNNYRYSNIWLFVCIQSPQGEQLIDTVEFTLAEPSGKWLGSGLGELFSQQFLYKENIAFPDSGVYKISIQQAMRDETLMGIDALGISIENR